MLFRRQGVVTPINVLKKVEAVVEEPKKEFCEEVPVEEKKVKKTSRKKASKVQEEVVEEKVEAVVEEQNV